MTKTSVGYTQGDVEAPSYQAVCSGATGHTEAVQVRNVTGGIIGKLGRGIRGINSNYMNEIVSLKNTQHGTNIMLGTSDAWYG